MVSVVIPVWQPDELHWRQCLASVLAQTYRPMEVIVADNDPAHGVAKRVTAEMADERLHYLPNAQHTGIFCNLNFALRQCSGAYIQIFCHDDRMLPGLLAAQVAGLSACPDAGFIYSQCHAIDVGGDRVQTCAAPAQPYLYFSPGRARMCFFKYGCLPGNLSAVMIRRRLLEANGFFEEKLRYASDFKYWVTATRHGGMAVSMEPLFEVRRHVGQASRVLGADLWMKESVPIYRHLYQQLPAHLQNWKTRMYANEHFGQHAFVAMLKQLMTNRKGLNPGAFASLNQPPFRLHWIFLLVLLSLRNRIGWFKLSEVDFYKLSEPVTLSSLQAPADADGSFSA